jgi:DNA-binding response OmpR family regulator
LAPMSDRAQPAVAVVADDLIWASRLTAAVEKGGGEPRVAATALALEALLPQVQAVVVDLGGRGYDGLAMVRSAASVGRPVIAAAQHDDLRLRKAALAAGARRVYSYNKLFSAGPALIAKLLGATA